MRTELVKEGGKFFVTPFGSKIEVDGAKGQALSAKGYGSQSIDLGVRPEHIVLAKKGEGIPCTLEVNEMMGSELHLHVVTNDNTELIVRVPTIDLSHEERAELTTGKNFHITFKGNVMNFFDVNTEENLLV